MVDTAFELMEYLTERGAPYGISAEELLEQIPEAARTPKTAYEFMQLKDISHIEPLSKGGSTAGDNWVLEDSSVNRSRGAETMSDSEIATAKADSLLDARKLAKTALVGGALTTGGAVADVALATSGAAVEAIAGEVVMATVLPIVVTTAAVAGTGFLAYKGAQRLHKSLKNSSVETSDEGMFVHIFGSKFRVPGR